LPPVQSWKRSSRASLTLTAEVRSPVGGYQRDVVDLHPGVLPDTLTAAGERLVDWGRRRRFACRAFLVEIHAVGQEGLEHRDRMMNLAVERFDRVAAWVRTVDPTLPTPPPLVGRAIVAASWELTSQAIRTPEDTTAVSREALAYIWLLGLTGRPQVGTQRRVT
jgi:hypothetical protein